MRQYSFIKESAVGNILALSGMTNLASNAGSAIGKHSGEYLSKLNTKELKANQVSWTDPLFTSIVKKNLVEAQHKIKLAKEWYDSCDKADKYRAKRDYDRAVREYKSIQRDISDRRADRWVEEYKKVLAIKNSEKFEKLGGLIAGGTAFAATAAKLLRKGK